VYAEFLKWTYENISQFDWKNLTDKNLTRQLSILTDKGIDVLLVDEMLQVSTPPPPVTHSVNKPLKCQPIGGRLLNKIPEAPSLAKCADAEKASLNCSLRRLSSVCDVSKYFRSGLVFRLTPASRPNACIKFICRAHKSKMSLCAAIKSFKKFFRFERNLMCR